MPGEQECDLAKQADSLQGTGVIELQPGCWPTLFGEENGGRDMAGGGHSKGCVSLHGTDHGLVGLQ